VEDGKGGVASLVASLPFVLLINMLIACYASGPTTAFEFVKGMAIANISWLAAAIVLAYGIHVGWNVMATSVAMMATYLALAKLASCMVV
jgi:NADH:ubiquinone oxidoreductase subunit F (NADH-binding)